MKKLIIASLLIIGITSFAQESKEKTNRTTSEKRSPEQRNEKHLEKLTKELSLNTTQKEQLAHVLAEQNTRKEAFKQKREANKANGLKPTTEEIEATKKQMQDNRTATENKIKSILSAEQFEKWNTNKEKSKEKLKAKRAEKKE